MNPLIVLDAGKVVPDRFALAVAAAARARALCRGAEPRLEGHVEPEPHLVSHLALGEIASRAFTEAELAPFLPEGATGAPGLPSPGGLPKVCDGREAAAAPVPAMGTVH
jgi:DNA-directed RNA polymerase subunit omega